MSAEDHAEELMGRLWREGARAFAAMAAAAASGSEGGGGAPRLDALWDGWTQFLDAMAKARAESAEAGDASPFDPAGWLRGPGDGGMADLWRWLEGPGFADVLSEERRLIRETREFLQYRAALEQYRAVMGQAWLRTFRAFAERLARDEDAGAADPRDDDLATGERAAAGAAGDAAPSWERLVALWREAADGEMAEVQASDAYVAANRDLASAHLALSASIRARVERLAEALGLPTRAEVDDLAAGMHAMEREIRTLKRQLRDMAEGADNGRGYGEGLPPGRKPGRDPGRKPS
ncbi:MAG: poly(R)-hydroxyalkanoic acid synthase subunit PhaE [Pseudomonadota bacterium]